MNLPVVILAFKIWLMRIGLSALAAIAIGGAGVALWRTIRRPIVAAWRFPHLPDLAAMACLCVACIMYECLGVTLPIPLSIIEPESILCDYAEFLPPAPGKPGCGMLLRLLVTPFVVSFHNLEIQEVPADLNNWQQWGSHSGYFADYAYYQYWCHTTHWGAGVWRGVDEFNSLDFDESRIGSWPQPWSTGYLSWKIPYGWRHKRSMTQACVGQIKPPSYSVWTMSTNLLEKTKHGYRVGISSSGQMFFEGALQNGN